MRKMVMGIGGSVAVALILWGALHVLITPINPDQDSPEEHFQSGCGMCHFVMSGVDLIE